MNNSESNQAESATRKLGAAAQAMLSEDDELKAMMRALLVDAIKSMHHQLKHGDSASKTAIQRMLLPHLAASATASAGRGDVRSTVESIHAETLAALLDGPDPEIVRLVGPTVDDE